MFMDLIYSRQSGVKKEKSIMNNNAIQAELHRHLEELYAACP
jgi:hypothetical protein